MKAYHKRLMMMAATVMLALVLTTVFAAGAFSVDATQLRIAPEGTAQSADGMRRVSRALPTAAEIDADGYDTLLPETFSTVLEDDKASLSFNARTGEVALRDKATGHIWFSNPQNRDGETLVEGTTRLRLGAQLTVIYYDAKGVYGQMDSYNDCVAYDAMTWELVDGELLVHYSLGKTVVTIADVPQQISKSRMERFISALSEADQEDLLKNYRLATIEGQTDAYIERIKAQCPNVVNEDTYYLVKDSTRILTKIRGYLDKCGYTTEDLIFDNEQNQVTSEVEIRAKFGVTLAYTLEDGALVCTLQGDSLTYEPTIPPSEIRVLEYFGAGDSTEKGYMLLPDGSGTLIYYNNGATTETAFSMRLYGDDTVSGTQSDYVIDKKASLPVFGIKNGRAALLVTVEEGAALCVLSARVAGMQNSYNTVYASVLTTAVERTTISDSEQIYFEREPSRDDVVIRYQPLEEADNDYMGMARVYRTRLLGDGTLHEQSEAVYPLVADVVCAVPTTKLFLGIPVSGMEAMTTYAQVREMAQTLDDGTAALWLRLEGWLRGGMEQSAFGSISAEGALGGAYGLNELIRAAVEEGWTLLPEVWLATAFNRSSLNISRDCVRNLARDVAVRYEYDYQNRYRRSNGRSVYQLNAARWTKNAQALGQGAARLGLSGVAVADIGSALWSDFRYGAAMNRCLMQLSQEAALSDLSQAAFVALRNPNLYALPYTDAIYDLPSSDSAFSITDESVPFYQAVIRGSIDYVCEPLNCANDYRWALLQAVECGAGLQYTLTWQTTALLKDTDYSYINRGRFSDWAETIVANYTRASAVLAPLAGVEMTGHERAAENLYVTTYADGTRVAVNYAAQPQTLDGVTVQAMDFAVVKVGER